MRHQCWVSRLLLVAGVSLLAVPSARAASQADMIVSFDKTTQVVSGTWNVVDGELRVGLDPASRAIIATSTPSSYALTLEFTRTAGDNSMGVILPVGGSQCAFILSAFSGEAHGIGIVDGGLARDNSTSIKPGNLETGHPYRLLIEVDTKGNAATIRSTLDGRPSLEWSGNVQSLSMRETWKLRSPRNIGLCTYAAASFHGISLRPLDPTMRMTKPIQEPPASAPSQKSVLYDAFHSTADVQPFTQIAQQTGFAVSSLTVPIDSERLNNHDAVYIRVPTKKFTTAEAAAVRQFVNNGGSLLIAMDEERRTPLAPTAINNLLQPFDLAFTDDTPYLHNCGAIAKSGLIHANDLELPFSGGRGVTGGQSFAFQLNQAGNPAQPFATSLQVPSGGRIVLLADGMAAALMGVPAGERLSGVPRDPTRTTYWGKDSRTFIVEVMKWLLGDD